MVDFKKLLNRTEEEKKQAEIEIETMRKEFLDSVKDDPDVRRMKKLCGDDE